MMRVGAPARRGSRYDARTREIERYLAPARGIRAISSGGESRRSLAYAWNERFHWTAIHDRGILTRFARARSAGSSAGGGRNFHVQASEGRGRRGGAAAAAAAFMFPGTDPGAGALRLHREIWISRSRSARNETRRREATRMHRES